MFPARALVRGLAGAAAAPAPQIPLRIYSLEGRYATAVYSAASRKDSLGAVEGELRRIKGAILKSARLRAFLHDPSLRREQKRDAVLAMLREQKYSEVVLGLFGVIAENGRLAQTVGIIDGFEEIMRAHRREVSVRLVSAKELPAEAVERVRQLVNTRFLAPGQVPKLSLAVDARLLGGIVLEVGDKTIDLSVLSRVNALDRALRETLDEQP